MRAGRLMLAVMAGGMLAGLSGCGDQQQVVLYKQGKYQGKPDTRPYENEAFGSDKAKWEAAIKARNLNQHEYKRIPG